jgi:HlyD family secretion protein
MKHKRWIGAAALLAVFGAAVWWWAARSADPTVGYRTAKLERGPLQAVVSASGTVTPVTQVQVSSQVSGQIKELFVDFNSEVKRDELIARLDPETFEYRLRQTTADLDAARASVLTAQANVQQALAQLGKARVDLQEAQRDLERKQELVAKNFISPAEIDKASALVRTLAESLNAGEALVAVARAQAQNSQAVVKQREAQLAQARVDLERTQIRSPVDGIVIKRSVEVGQTVAASLQAPELFVIAANLNDMQIETSIDEADIARVRNAQKVAFTIDAFPGRNFEGTVKQVRKAAVSAQNVTTYTVVVAFANSGVGLLPGMTANVRIVTDTRDSALKVPNAALRMRLPGIEPAAAPTDAASPPERAAPAAASTAAGPGGAALREFRDRLVGELKLTPAQADKVDTLFTDARPRFSELRTLAEEERAKARDRILADIRTRVADLLTPEQRPKYQQMLSEIGGRQSTRGRIYLLGEGNKPQAYSVRLGITDGVSTELIVAAGGGAVADGASVITGINNAAAGGPRPTTPGGLRPPF